MRGPADGVSVSVTGTGPPRDGRPPTPPSRERPGATSHRKSSESPRLSVSAQHPALSRSRENRLKSRRVPLFSSRGVHFAVSLAPALGYESAPSLLRLRCSGRDQLACRFPPARRARGRRLDKRAARKDRCMCPAGAACSSLRTCVRVYVTRYCLAATGRRPHGGSSKTECSTATSSATSIRRIERGNLNEHHELSHTGPHGSIAHRSQKAGTAQMPVDSERVNGVW